MLTSLFFAGPARRNPSPTVFELTSVEYSPTDDMSEACIGFGDEFHIADWTEVVEAVNAGAAKEDISSALYALILNDGVGYFQTGFPTYEDRHYALSYYEPLSSSDIVDSVGPGTVWLTSTTDPQPVLCTGPSS